MILLIDDSRQEANLEKSMVLREISRALRGPLKNLFIFIDHTKFIPSGLIRITLALKNTGSDPGSPGKMGPEKLRFF